MALAQQHRLPVRAFQRVLAQGKTVQDSFFFFKILPNELRVLRIGIGVPTRLVPRAVDRVAVRRRAVREVEPVVKDGAVGYDIVVMVRKLPPQEPSGQLGRALRDIVIRLEKAL